MIIARFDPYWRKGVRAGFGVALTPGCNAEGVDLGILRSRLVCKSVEAV